jgi:hypothetical protein
LATGATQRRDAPSTTRSLETKRSLGRIHSREEETVELERHIVLISMMATGKTTRGRVSAGGPDDAYEGTPPVDPHFATGPVAYAAWLDATSQRSAE